MSIVAFKNTSANSWINRSTALWNDSVAIVSIRNSLEGVYNLVNLSHRLLIDQPYYLSDVKRNSLEQVYGIKLLAQLLQQYNDVSTVRNILTQWYWSNPLKRRTLEQKYDDAPRFRNSLKDIYHIYKTLEIESNQLYSVTGTALQTEMIQPFDLIGTNLITKELNQIYLILGDTSSSDIDKPEV
jgi:hypothetical protein